MADATDIVITVGALGAAYWFVKGRDNDADERANKYLMDSVRATQYAEQKDREANEANHRAADAGASAQPARTVQPPRPMGPVRATGALPSKARPIVTAPAPGPILVAPPSPTQPISRAFDPLFAAFGPTMPTAYLRALAAHESDMHPDAAGGRGRGLFSVVDVLRSDFNERHGTHFSADDLRSRLYSCVEAVSWTHQERRGNLRVATPRRNPHEATGMAPSPRSYRVRDPDARRLPT